jgi:hypothetical protein
MGALFGIVANDAAVGGTIGTFDAIDTRNGDIRLREGTTGVVGLAVCAARTAQTTGDAQLYRIRFNSSDMSVIEEDFALGTTHGGGIATQSQGYAVPAEWISLDLPAGPGNVVNLSFSQMGIESADSVEVEASVAHLADTKLSRGRPPPAWLDAAMQGRPLPAQGSRSSNGGSTADARTSLTSTNLPSRFQQIVGGRYLQAQDAVAANGEASVAFVELTSTMGEIVPNEWPTNGIQAPLAGTLVGMGQMVFQPPLPQRILKEAKTETLEPFVDVLTAIAAANAFGYAVTLRKGVGFP